MAAAMEEKRRTARSLVDRLREEEEGDALAEIHRLSKHDAEIRSRLAEAGAVPILAGLLPGAGGEHAAAALLNLSISSGDALMSTPGLLDALAVALRPRSADRHPVAQHAAATIYSLLSSSDDLDYRPIIGGKLGLVSALIDIVRSTDSPTRSVKDALRALFGISLYQPNRAAMVDLGAVPALFELVVADGRTGIVEDSTAVIAQVAGCYESVGAFREVGGARILVEIVAGGGGESDRARENAASGLLNLVMSGGDAAVEDVLSVASSEAALRGLLAASGAGEGRRSRARSKAESLLLILGGHRCEQEQKQRRRMSLGDLFSSPESPPETQPAAAVSL